jgi:uncharacterized protein (DUF58 family)
LSDKLHQAEGLSGNLPGLLLKAEKVAHTFMKGVHGRRRVGMGETFWQFRHYAPGDTSRDIDWKLTAKRDDPYVRQMEWEASQTLWLYRDASQSMDFHSARGLPSKRDYAEVLLLALGILALGGGEQVSLLGTDLAPQSQHNAIRRIHDTLPQQVDFVETGRMIAARSHVIILSDFFFPLEQLAVVCERLAFRHVRGTLVQICDPAEEKLPYRGRVKFADIESNAAAVTVPQVEAIRDAYHDKFIAHRAQVQGIAASRGWAFHALSTATPHVKSLSHLFDALKEG